MPAVPRRPRCGNARPAVRECHRPAVGRRLPRHVAPLRRGGPLHRPGKSPPRSRRSPGTSPIPLPIAGFHHRATASARSEHRAPRPRRRGWCGPQPAPSRSMRLREVQEHCEFGDRPATAVPRCRRRTARRGAPVPPAAARASPAVDAQPPMSRLEPGGPDRPGSTTTTGASKPAAVRPPAPQRGTGRRSPPRHRRCAGRRATHAARAAAAVRAAYRPAPPPACPGPRPSSRRRGSAADAVPTRRKPGSHPRAQPAPRPRSAPCGEGCPPSSCHRSRAPRAGRTASRSSRGPRASTARGRPARHTDRRGSGPPAVSVMPRRRPPHEPSPRAVPTRRPAHERYRWLHRSPWTAAKPPPQPRRR
ncbi:hypothetical protein DE4576_05420 [Mycobacterium marinum]|nr:hypothetical protein DE4576_05420 [Mycobacterium marinum]